MSSSQLLGEAWRRFEPLCQADSKDARALRKAGNTLAMQANACKQKGSAEQTQLFDRAEKLFEQSLKLEVNEGVYTIWGWRWLASPDNLTRGGTGNQL